MTPVLLALTLALLAQAPPPGKPQASKPKSTRVKTLTQDQVAKATVEENRGFAGRRPVRPRGALFSWELERAKVFREAKDSVVFVTTLAKVPSPDGTGLVDAPDGSGSGLVWDHAGHVVTNYHVVERAVVPSEVNRRSLDVTLADGRRYQARVIGYSPAYDVAVLHVFAPLAALKPLAVGTSRDLVVGQGVLAIGNPYGLDHSMSQGIVSALGRELDTTYGTKVKGVIQTDAAINPGNSGGPLLDSAGRLIGMNTAIAPATGASVGIGFAIPVDMLQEVVPTLIAQERLVRKLYFGFQTLPHDVAQQVLGLRAGALVAKVDLGSPAAKAGLKAWVFEESKDAAGAPVVRVVEPGDIIVGCRDAPVEHEYQLYAMLEQTPEGQPLQLNVLRNGQVIRIDITPERRSPPPEAPAAKKADA